MRISEDTKGVYVTAITPFAAGRSLDLAGTDSLTEVNFAAEDQAELTHLIDRMEARLSTLGLAA